MCAVNEISHIPHIYSIKDVPIHNIYLLQNPDLGPGNPKQKMIMQWMKEDPDASWERLQKALTTPAMCENRVAKSIADSGRGSSCSTANSGLLNRAN